MSTTDPTTPVRRAEATTPSTTTTKDIHIPIPILIYTYTYIPIYYILTYILLTHNDNHSHHQKRPITTQQNPSESEQ